MKKGNEKRSKVREKRQKDPLVKQVDKKEEDESNQLVDESRVVDLTHVLDRIILQQIKGICPRLPFEENCMSVLEIIQFILIIS